MKIAFGFNMRVGKDEAVEYLLSKYGGNKITFADPLYEILYHTQNAFGFIREKDREFLQMIGMWARSKDPNVFVKLALEDVNDDENFFCNDLRFANEFSALKTSGWICVKILRKTNIISEHQSEVELTTENNWDYVVENNGSLEEFHKKLDDIVCKIKKSL